MQEQEQQQQQAPAPAAPSVEVVHSVLQACTSTDTSTRNQAEALIRGWETDAAPGFLSSLLRIVEQTAGVDEVGRDGLDVRGGTHRHAYVCVVPALRMKRVDGRQPHSARQSCPCTALAHAPLADPLHTLRMRTWIL